MSGYNFHYKSGLVKDDQGKVPVNIKKTEGTTNKLYRAAELVQVSLKHPANHIKNLEFKYKESPSVIKEISELEDKIDKRALVLNYYNEYRRKLVDSYLSESIDNSKDNLERLRKCLLEVSEDEEEKKKIKEIKSNLGVGFDPFVLKIITKYKLKILKNLNFRVLSEEMDKSSKFQKIFGVPESSFQSWQNQLIVSPTSEHSKTSLQKKNLQSSDHQYRKESLKKVSEKIGFDLIDIPNYRKSTTTHSSEDSESFLTNILINDFRSSVKISNLPDDVCLNYLKRSNNKLMEAVDLFFQERFHSNKLRVIYVFPDQKEYISEFAFTDSPDDIFIPVYANYPYANQIEIFYGNRKLEINPFLHTFIGHLNLPNNSKLYVVCK